MRLISMLKNKKILIPAGVIIIVVLIVSIMLVTAPETADYSLIKNIDSQTETPVYNDSLPEIKPEGETLIGQSGEFALYYEKDTTVFTVRDTRNNFWSSSAIKENYFTPDRDTPVLKKDLSRLCQVGYTDFKGTDDNISSSRTPYTITEKGLENGVALEVMLNEYEIGFTVEVWLDTTGLRVRVPRNSIVEAGDFGITNLSLFPLFGAAQNSTDGFILFPDGSGSLFEFSKASQQSNPLTTDVYSPISFDLDLIENAQRQKQYNLLLPVYGISRGSTAILKYITSGDTSSFVTVNPSGNIYNNLNRVSDTIIYRKSYTYTTPTNLQVTEVERTISAGDYSAVYFLMQNETPVTYSEMANAVRHFMIQTDRLNQTASQNPKVNIHLLMGTKVDTMLSEKFRSLTTFSQASQILTEIEKDNHSNTRLTMLGWEQNGYGLLPAGNNASASLGGSKGLKSLNKLLQNWEVENYFAVNYTQAEEGGAGFKAGLHAVYNEMRLPITNAKGDQYLLNPLIQLKEARDTRLPYLRNNEAKGVAFDSLGRLLYGDYQAKRSLTREQCALTALALLKETKKSGMNAAVQNGNAYILPDADYLYDIPESNSRFALMTKEIPFYQLVVHGSIPYSGTIPGNMSPDYQALKLRWIEYGYEPYFLFTHESSEKMRNTNITEAMATEYENWIDEVKSCLAEWKDKLAFTVGNAITGHREIEPDVIEICYESGEKILINYSNSEKEISGIKISKMNYQVDPGEGK